MRRPIQRALLACAEWLHYCLWLGSPGGPWSWPTDGCGYDQHIRFVRYRNENWHGGDFNQFVRDYADALEKEPE